MKPLRLFLVLLSSSAVILGSCSSKEETASTDAGLDCTTEHCDTTKCIWLNVDGGAQCLPKPTCAELGETACAATDGCQVVMGRIATEPPGTAIHYAGCATGKGDPGSAFACGAPNPQGPCWVFPNYHAPTGWTMWSCTGDEQTLETCMAQSPW